MRKLFHHVCGVDESPEGLTPRRFTQAQLDALQAQRPFFGRAGRNAAGVTLECITAAPVLRFSYGLSHFYTRAGGFDVEEDGVVTGHVPLPQTAENGDACEGVFVWERQTRGAKRVRIFLPHNARFTLRAAELGDWTPVEAPQKQMLFLGDSLTQSAYTTHPCAGFAALLADSLGMDWVNRGVGSLYYCAATLDPKDPLHPDQVLVEFGPNDLVRRGPDNEPLRVNGQTAYYPPQELGGILQNAREYLETLHMLWPDARRMVLTTPWCVLYGKGSPDYRDKVDAYRTSLAALAADLGCQVLDGHRLMPHDPDFHMPDGVHFNVAGGYAMAAALRKALEG